MTALARIASLLQRSFGLDAAAVGAATLERSVRRRAVAAGSADLDAYLQELQRRPEELQELTEALVVPETWFFRDPAAFQALAQSLRERPADAALRLLSLPCSTGEEPYTLAMTLLDSGRSPQRFTVDAVDISQRALAQARRGEYGRNSFRGGDLAFRERHFEDRGEGRYRVSDVLRQSVHWHFGNLFGADLLDGRAPYQVIFCRNLLIYFGRAAQEQALEVLNRRLADDGLIFVGPSEAPLLLASGFESLKLPGSFGFRRARPIPASPPARVQPARLSRPAPAEGRRSAPKGPAAAAARAQAPPPARPPVDPLLEAARLADEGRFDEAERLCQQHLREKPASAQALYLLGLLNDARGDAERSAACYRRALYLDPTHEQALLHLAVLREKQGDSSGARRLHERARRLRGPVERGSR